MFVILNATYLCNESWNGYLLLKPYWKVAVDLWKWKLNKLKKMFRKISTFTHHRCGVSLVQKYNLIIKHAAQVKYH